MTIAALLCGIAMQADKQARLQAAAQGGAAAAEAGTDGAAAADTSDAEAQQSATAEPAQPAVPAVAPGVAVVQLLESDAGAAVPLTLLEQAWEPLRRAGRDGDVLGWLVTVGGVRNLESSRWTAGCV